MTVGSASGYPLASRLNSPPQNKTSDVPAMAQCFTCRRGLMVKLPAVGFMHDTYCTFVISFSDSLVLSYLWEKQKQRHGDHSLRATAAASPLVHVHGLRMSTCLQGGQILHLAKAGPRLACMSVHGLAHTSPALGGNLSASTTCS